MTAIAKSFPFVIPVVTTLLPVFKAGAIGVTNAFFKNLPPPARAPLNFLSGAVFFRNLNKSFAACTPFFNPLPTALAKSFILLIAATPKSNKALPILLSPLPMTDPPFFNKLPNNLKKPFKPFLIILIGALRTDLKKSNIFEPPSLNAWSTALKDANKI